MATAYIETTIPSYYVARPSTSLLQAARQSNTCAWWDAGCSGFDLFVSQETLDETGKGESAMADDRLALIRDLPVLEVSETAAALTKTLLAKGLVPTKAASDAIHIAVASVHAMDYLVTWNFKHIANPFIRNRLRDVVCESGFRLPVICTPEELLNNESD